MSAETRTRAIEALLDHISTEVMAALLAQKIADPQRLLVACLDAASPTSQAKH